MYRQKFAAAQALEILQNLPSDCSGNENSGSEMNKEMIDSTVAGAGEFELSSSDSTWSDIVCNQTCYLWQPIVII